MTTTIRLLSTTCRRILLPVALLAGLLTCEVFAASTEQQTLAAIARRSFDAGEALAIARRSVGATTPKPVRTQPSATFRSRIVTPEASGTRSGRPPTTLDPVRLERTERYRGLIEHHSRLHHVDRTGAGHRLHRVRRRCSGGVTCRGSRPDAVDAGYGPPIGR